MDARLPAGGRRSAFPVILTLFLLVAACSSPQASMAPPSASTPAPASEPATAAPATAAPSADASASPVAAFPLTLTDDEGTELTLEAEPKRIAALTPAATETLFALGLGDRVVARAEDLAPHPAGAEPIPVVARFDGVDVEQLVALEPDLVIAGGNFFTPADAIEQLRAADIPVLVVYAPDVATVSSDIELIGAAAGRPTEAEAITERIESEFEAVGASVGGLPAPRVFYELDATGAIYGPADESFLAEMIEIAGGDPITTGSPDLYEIAIERLIEADPEIILLADAPFGVTPEMVAERPGWDVMTAVREGEVRPIDDLLITRPGPRIFLGLQQLAAAIHPEAPVPSSEPIPAEP